jgi:hypothetical protein
MKAEELRVGNLVYYKLKDQLIVFTIDNGKQIDTYLKVFEPIPINEEWFIKFGFELHFGKYFKGNFHYNPEVKMFFWYGIPLLDSLWNEVHKLQNLHFALTGQEITIK